MEVDIGCFCCENGCIIPLLSELFETNNQHSITLRENMASVLPPSPVTMYIDTVRIPDRFVNGACQVLHVFSRLGRFIALVLQLLRENEALIHAVHELQQQGRVREMTLYLERLVSSTERLGKLLDLQRLSSQQLPERREVRNKCSICAIKPTLGVTSDSDCPCSGSPV